MLTCDNLPYSGLSQWNSSSKLFQLVESIQFPVHHKESVKTNKNESMITEKFNLLFRRTSYHGLLWSRRDAAAHQVRSNVTGLISKLIGGKLKNSLNDLIFFLDGGDKLWKIVGEVKTQTLFTGEWFYRPGFYKGTFQDEFSRGNDMFEIYPIQDCGNVTLWISCNIGFWSRRW